MIQFKQITKKINQEIYKELNLVMMQDADKYKYNY